MRPLRFCLLTTFYPPCHFGGDAVFVKRLASALADDGHHVEVICDVDAFELGRGREKPGENDPRVAVHALRGGVAPKLDLVASHQVGAPLLKRKQIDSILRAGRFDVLHFHNVSLLGGPSILRHGDALKLCTMHDYWFVCAMHVLWRFDREACAQRTCLRCTLRGGRPPQLWRYSGAVGRAASSVDAFITGSEFSRVAHRANGFSAPINVIPHFVPRSGARDVRQAAHHSDRPFFLYAGRLEKLKGIADLARFFAGYPAADLFIAGTGALEEELRGLAARVPNIRLLGWQRSDDLRDLYRQAVAAIVPSLCYETFGFVAAEAFAEGTPAVVREIGALPEVVSAGGGFVYRDDGDLRKHLDALLADPQLRATEGEAARRRYESEYAPEVHLRRYYSLIEQTMEKRAR